MTITIREQQDAASNTVGLSFTLGAGTTVGDTIYLLQTNDWYALANLQTPTGTAVTTWALKFSLDLGTNNIHYKVWEGVVTTGGTSTVVVNSATTDEERYAGVWVVPAGTTYDTATTSTGTGTVSHVAPTVTPTVGNTDDQLICHFQSRTEINYTMPGSMVAYTERDFAGFMTQRSGSEQMASDAATGTRTATASSAADFVTLSLLIKTTAAATVPPAPTTLPQHVLYQFLEAAWSRRQFIDVATSTPWTVDQTDSAGLTDSVAFEQQDVYTDSAGLTDGTEFAQLKVATDSAGLTDTATVAATFALAQTDNAGLTDAATVELVKAVSATDDAGLTDTAAIGQARVVTDSAGLTDGAGVEQQKVATDSAGLTDSHTEQLAKLITATDDAGLTDTTALARTVVLVDSAGLTDAAALTQAKVFTDSAGLTDTPALQLVKPVDQTDSAGLTDSAAFARATVVNDDAGLTDAAALAQTRLFTDSAGLTDTAAADLISEVTPGVLVVVGDALAARVTGDPPTLTATGDPPAMKVS